MQKFKYPTFIYKYCDLKKDPESNKIYSLENLKNNQVWFSNPNGFNDPFDINKEKLKESILYKFKEWKYEKEWRVVTTKNEHQLDFFDATPQAIYLGTKIDNANEIIIRDIAVSKDIPVYKMKLDTHKYRLVNNGK